MANPVQRLDPIIFRQLTIIHKIIEDETWLEGERRGCWVSVDDPVVRENVCQVVLRIGREMRETVAKALLAERNALKADQQKADRDNRAA